MHMIPIPTSLEKKFTDFETKEHNTRENYTYILGDEERNKK